MMFMMPPKTQLAATQAWRASKKAAGLVLLAVVLIASGGEPAFADTVIVTKTSPASGATVTSPVTFAATATSSASNPITGFVVYANNKNVFQNDVTSPTLNTSVALSPGTYSVYIRAWDSSGAYGTSPTFTLTVGTGSTSSSTSSGSGVTVTQTAPANGATLESPITFTATASGPDPITGFVVYANNENVYQNDVTSPTMSASITLNPGTYSVYIRAWDSSGAYGTSPTTTLTVGSGSSSTASSGSSSTTTNSGSSLIPSNAVSSGDLDGSSAWEWNHDPGTSGTSTGTSVYPVTLDGYSDVREMDVTNYTDYGGEIYHIDFANDTTSTNFIYDVYVYLPNPSEINNLEMDMNQVMSNGDTVIYGFQCDSGSGTWDYTYMSSGSHWTHSKVPCNVHTWAANTWHHVQISTQRNSAGDVTYNWVALDGVVSDIGVTVSSAENLGWGVGDLLLNFQLDGSSSGSGSMVAYIHDMTIYRW